MKRITKKYFRKSENGFSIWCPACGCGHFFDKRWNLDEKAKTVTPSMNVNNEECHFNVTDGKIIYHANKYGFSGKTIDMIKF